jgi:hypothetical protein
MIIVFLLDQKKVKELLVDAHDFKNFCSEYTKLTAAKKIMVIFVTVKKKDVVKRKKDKVSK